MELEVRELEEKIDVTTDCGFQKGLQLKYKEKIGYVLLLKKRLVLQISETVDKQNCSYAHVINSKLKPNVLPIRQNVSNFEKRFQIIVSKAKKKKKRSNKLRREKERKPLIKA